MKKQLFTILAFILSIYLVNAQPTTFSYQAVVRDMDGNLISDQQILLRLSISDTEETTYYEEEHQTSTNEFGQIQIEVGGGTQLFGDFETVPWSSTQLLLTVNMSMDEGVSFTNLGQSPMHFMLLPANPAPKDQPEPA